MKEKELIDKTEKIIEEYNSNTADDKTSFNIFTILREEDEEVMLHSRFIYELLNPRGSHLMKQKYLSLFLNVLENKAGTPLPHFLDEHLLTATVYRERFNIDLLIYLPNGYTMIIENKIYAYDQQSQLDRYFNTVVNQCRRDENKIFIVYLMLKEQGAFVIAKELTKMQSKTKRGNIKWNESAVRGIVKNEKYKGDLLLGKTFTVDPLTHRRLENMGEEEKYYITGNHEPLISEELFDEAHKILAIRSSKHNNKGRTEKYSKKYAFSSLIKCGFCGGTAVRRTWHSKSDHEKAVWSCMTATKEGKKYCPDSKGVPEYEIEQAFIDAFNMYMVI